MDDNVAKRDEVPETDSGLLTTEEAAKWLGIEPRSLSFWRSKNTGPAFVKLGERTIRYRREDLIAYAEASVVEPGDTGDARAPGEG